MQPGQAGVTNLRLAHTAKVFAGDTAQTISKGIDFRFNDLRTLFLEEFLGGRDWIKPRKRAGPPPRCTMCEEEFFTAGGVIFECHSGCSLGWGRQARGRPPKCGI